MVEIKAELFVVAIFTNNKNLVELIACKSKADYIKGNEIICSINPDKIYDLYNVLNPEGYDGRDSQESYLLTFSSHNGDDRLTVNRYIGEHGLELSNVILRNRVFDLYRDFNGIDCVDWEEEDV